MSIEAPEGIHHEFVARKRDLIVQRLSRALEAIDRKRHAVSAVVADVASLVPGHSKRSEGTGLSAPTDDRVRGAVLGAVAGGAVMAVGLYLEHRRRERNRPLKVVQRAWFKYAMPPQPSLFKRLVADAVGSLLMSVASEVARAGVQKVLELQAPSDAEGPVVIDRTSDLPDPSFVTEPVTVDPGVMHPREAALPPSGIAPPDPIAPLQSPLREFA